MAIRIENKLKRVAFLHAHHLITWLEIMSKLSRQYSKELICALDNELDGKLSFAEAL